MLYNPASYPQARLWSNGLHHIWHLCSTRCANWSPTITNTPSYNQAMIGFPCRIGFLSWHRDPIHWLQAWMMVLVWSGTFHSSDTWRWITAGPRGNCNCAGKPEPSQIGFWARHPLHTCLLSMWHSWAEGSLVKPHASANQTQHLHWLHIQSSRHSLEVCGAWLGQLL